MVDGCAVGSVKGRQQGEDQTFREIVESMTDSASNTYMLMALWMVAWWVLHQEYNITKS